MTALASLTASPNLAHLHAALGLPDEAPPPHELSLALDIGAPHPLAARWFEPPQGAHAVALMAPATGVPQRFYAALARWLALRGYAVLTLDYAGIAGSRAAAPLGASMRDWMQRDLVAAHQAVRERAQRAPQRLPTLWIGHSLGGHALTLQPALQDVDAALLVGGQLPAFQRWAAGLPRWGARFFFRRYVPALVRLTGRLPGWALGGGESLPAAAALDWSHWGQLPNYLASDPTLADAYRPQALRGVVHAWCVADDWVFGPEPAVQALVDAFAGSSGRATLQRIAPAQIGLRRLGHFAPFSRKVGDRLWSRWFDTLEAEVPALRRR